MKDNQIDIQTQKRIAKFLSQAIKTTLDSYDIFVAQELVEQDQSKEFLSYHNACKSAVSHLEVLLKLSEWARVHDGKNSENKELMEMLSLASQHVEKERLRISTNKDE